MGRAKTKGFHRQELGLFHDCTLAILGAPPRSSAPTAARRGVHEHPAPLSIFVGGAAPPLSYLSSLSSPNPPIKAPKRIQMEGTCIMPMPMQCDEVCAMQCAHHCDRFQLVDDQNN